MKKTSDAPSWPEALEARAAHATAVAEHGAQSEEAKAAVKTRIAAELKCAQEVGINLPSTFDKYR